MNFLLSSICFYLLFGIFANCEDGHCIWYGQCGENMRGMEENCPYSKQAKPLTDQKSLETLKSICPSYVNNYGNETRTCCSPNQIETLAENLQAPMNFFSRCPSCQKNFMNLYCHFTCSPDQSRYVTAVETEGQGNKTRISAVKYSLTPDFANGLFDSCKNVQMPSNNERALSLVCGIHADKCNISYWLHYMGTPEINALVPFSINFSITDKPEPKLPAPMNGTIIPCNVALDNTSSSCSCQDCITACPAPPSPPPKSKPFIILDIDGYLFIASIIFLLFLLIFGSFQIWYHVVSENSMDVKRKKKKESDIGSDKKKEKEEEAKSSCLRGYGYKLEMFLERTFEAWGNICASHPFIIILSSVLVAIALSLGLLKFQVTTDPVQLWSSPTSSARVEKQYFDDHFGPFYRTEQIIVKAKGNPYFKRNNTGSSIGTTTWSSLLRKEVLEEILVMQNHVMENIAGVHEGKNVTLNDICYKPLSPDNDNCAVMSVLQFFQNEKKNIELIESGPFGFGVIADYGDHLMSCFSNPLNLNDTTIGLPCISSFGAPISPWVVLGGFPGEDFTNATAVILSFVVSNSRNEEKVDRAMAWEKVFIDYMKSYKSDLIDISYTSERSIQDEINRESQSDVSTILISYLLMFAYVSFALGRLPSECSRFFIISKFGVGLAGVLIVLTSVIASLGFFSYCGVAATLIIIEVVPFLVLAVGVDNMFILVQAYQRHKFLAKTTVPERVGIILGKVGPSMLLTSLSESIAFFVGAMADMPAVRAFSLYAAMAVFLDFLLQITCFVAVFALDIRRMESGRLDILCCVRGNSKKNSYGVSTTDEEGACSNGLVYTCFEKGYTRVLMRNYVRPFVVIVFVGLFLGSLAAIPHVEIGLDQRLSMPTDSFVLDWMNDQINYLSVGPPVYFVVQSGYDYRHSTTQNLICGSSGCNSDSLLGQIFSASLQPDYWHIAQTPASWIDDYFDWLRPIGNPQCCREFKSGHGFCPSSETNSSLCENCPVKYRMGGRPSVDDFNQYLPMFLKDNPGILCTKGGHAAYGAAVQLHPGVHNMSATVGATYFMTYHTVQKTSSDYTDAIRKARFIADNATTTINRALHEKRTFCSSLHKYSQGYAENDCSFFLANQEDVSIFPYSVFYVFYQQYLDIVHNSLVQLSSCLAAMFVVSVVLLGFDFWSAGIILLVVTMILCNLLGWMWLLSIPLNAISLVNLVMAIGISVEFCSHLVRKFSISVADSGSRLDRAKDTLTTMGTSVLSGITLTKLVGVVVLSFSKSRLFFVFYFGMYSGIVLLGALYGLLFLPVLLSYCGPPLNNERRLHSSSTSD